MYPLLKKALGEYYELPHASEKMLIAQLTQQGVDEHLIKQVVSVLYDANRASRYSQGEGDASLVKRASALLTLLGKVLVLMLVWVPLEASEVLDQATSLSGTVPFVVWQLGVLIGWSVLWLAYKRLSSEMRVLLVVVWLFFVGGWALRSRSEYRPRVKIGQNTQLYVGPGTEYPVRAVLGQNDEVVLVKRRDPWYYVKSAQGIGWVQQDSIAKDGIK